MISSTWPKTLPPLTPEQQRISDDFMKHWHEVLPNKYGIIDDFNHGYAVRAATANFRNTLEIGAGLGEHLAYENLSSEQERQYVALELRANMADQIRQRFPKVQTLVGDCQKPLPFEAGAFDRILAIHVLEHLPDLPAALLELRRLCHAQGKLHAVIPCEGGMAYTLARRISAQRVFEKRYQQPYDWFIQREHLNRPREIIDELTRHFRIVDRSFFPFRLPWVFCNLCIGLTLEPR